MKRLLCVQNGSFCQPLYQLFVFGLFLFSPLVIANQQWPVHDLPPSAQTLCPQLFESPSDNSFLNLWSLTEQFLQQRRMTSENPISRSILKVYVPSMTLDYAVIGKINNISSYELRGLCQEVIETTLDPGSHLLIVTSDDIEPAFVKKCIEITIQTEPVLTSEHARTLQREVNQIFRQRFHFFSTQDTSPLPLVQKLLQNSSFIEQLENTVRQIQIDNNIPPEGVFMKTFVTTLQEGMLSKLLGVSVWGNPLYNFFVEAKSKYHEVMQKVIAQVGPNGVIFKAPAMTKIDREEKLIEAIVKMVSENLLRGYVEWRHGNDSQGTTIKNFYMQLSEAEKIVQIRKLILKWDLGTSGQGNASKLVSGEVVDLIVNNEILKANELVRQQLLENLKPSSKELTPQQFVRGLVAHQGVVEQFLPNVMTFTNDVGDIFPVSPSGQGDVYNNQIAVRGCHEQKFKPNEDGVFDGAIYGQLTQKEVEHLCGQIYDVTISVGEYLRSEGYLGRFAVDFVLTKNPTTGEVRLVVIEINARSGGTQTVDTMRALTEAFQYLPDEVPANLEPYHWYADLNGEVVQLFNEGTDNFEHWGLKLFCSDQELIDFLYERDPLFWSAESSKYPMANRLNKRGIVPHMIQGRSNPDRQGKGKIGFVAIGHHQLSDARQLFSGFKYNLSRALDNYQRFHAEKKCN